MYQKTGKIRKISVPCYSLKKIQSIILNEILYKIPIDQILEESCTGFVPGKSIINNATFHLGHYTIINIDIADFFPSISREMIYNIFRYILNFSTKDSYYLSCLSTYNNILPQGSPTSPMLANFVARHIDVRILSYLKKIGGNMSYSRYADDITIGFSGNLNPLKIINFVYDVLDTEGFQPNYQKTRIISKGQKQEVTGLIINSDKPTLGKKKLDFYRAIFHSVKKNGWKKAINIWNKKMDTYRSVDELKKHLGGRLSFVKDIHPNYYDKYIILFQ